MSGSSLKPPLWNETTALFGGTFDPPHLGHRAAIAGLFRDPGIQRVWIFPSPCPPHKPAYASLEDRIRMTELMLQDSKSPLPGPVRIDRTEIEWAARNPGKAAYSYFLLQELGRELKSRAFVIGADQLQALPQWHRFPEVLGLCHWIVLMRKPDGEATARRTLAEWEASGLAEKKSQDLWLLKPGKTYLKLATTEAPRVSSSQIREEIAKAGTVDPAALSPSVFAHLKLHRIYGTNQLEWRQP